MKVDDYMDIDPDWYYACGRKKGFDTRKKAAMYMQAARKRLCSDNPLLAKTYCVYKCKYCGMWHVGKERRKRLRVERRELEPVS